MSEKKPTPPRSVWDPTEMLGGANPRGETAGCPTGLASDPQRGTPPEVAVPPSPGEGVTEADDKRSGLDRG